jgi:hypothetical protein
MKNQKDKLVLITAVFTLPLLLLYFMLKTSLLALVSKIGLIVSGILVIGRIIKP